MDSRKDPAGRLPLHYVALSDNVEKATECLAAGDDPNAQDAVGYTPLHMAAERGSLGVAQLLLDQGAEVDRTNTYGNSPLWIAVFNSKGRGELISLLRGRGADPLKKNGSGRTPLDLARLIGTDNVAQWFADLPAGQPSPEPPRNPDRPKNVDAPTSVSEAAALWQAYVPKFGQADTVQGELLRAVEKLRDEALRNGNQNWGEGHVILAEFLRDTLSGSGLSDEAAATEINRDVARLFDFDHPASEETFDRLTDGVVEWSRGHPEPVAHEHNPRLIL